MMLLTDRSIKCSSKRALYCDCDKISRGSPAKSDPLDFPTKNSFSLSIVHEKGLVHMSKNRS